MTLQFDHFIITVWKIDLELLIYKMSQNVFCKIFYISILLFFFNFE